MKDSSTYSRIVEAADELFYRQGFEHTSFAQIAKKVNISRGNFYYHFKTKDKILDAVIAKRLKNTEMMLDKWEIEGESPLDRIQSFINILITNQVNIQRYGCPVGTLNSELSKLKHPSKPEANKLFLLFRSWLSRQFEQLNYSKEADDLAMHLLAFSQGVAVLSSTFEDEAFIKKEVKRLSQWLKNEVIKKH